MAEPADAKAAAEAVRLRRIRNEQLESLARTRASIGRFGGRPEATSTRVFKYVLWFLAALYILNLGVVYIVYPLIEADFSKAAIRQAVMMMVLVVGMIFIVNFYDKTPVNHLTRARRAAVNGLLCIGGLIFMASCFLLGWAHAATFVLDVAAIAGMCVAVLVLLFAGKIAKAHE